MGLNKGTTVSVIVRTLNEACHLGSLLEKVKRQKIDAHVEVIVVDSGSTDDTLSIARNFGCRIVYIAPEEFTFGRSLNLGCANARGEILVFVSGHCVPVDEHWLERLVEPLCLDSVEYSYGRQHPVMKTRRSETRIFRKYFPPESAIPQRGFFCNNANAALTWQAWNKLRFDETLTGLEDLELARRIRRSGNRLAYVAEAGVYHIHNENWHQVWRRFEREAFALRRILPDVRFGIIDLLGCLASGISGDIVAELRDSARPSELYGCFVYRLTQYLATFRGNHRDRTASDATTLRYYYPDVQVRAILDEDGCITAHESK